VIWGEHDGVLRSVILALKHGGRDDLAPPLGERMASMVGGQPWSREIDAVCAVPSHVLRRMRRPWPAAELLARDIARRLNRPMLRPLRRRGLRRQTGQSRAFRLTLSRYTFAATAAVRGRGMLLIDDVTTTGATVRRASEALSASGAKAVYCAIAAHTPDPRRVL
jgi:predicted amidophosphoribosyltransferase